MIADELNPPLGLFAEVSIDETDDAVGVRATVNEVTHLNDDEVVGQPAVVVGAEAAEFSCEFLTMPTDIADHGDTNTQVAASFASGRPGTRGRVSA